MREILSKNQNKEVTYGSLYSQRNTVDMAKQNCHHHRSQHVAGLGRP